MEEGVVSLISDGALERLRFVHSPGQVLVFKTVMVEAFDMKREMTCRYFMMY